MSFNFLSLIVVQLKSWWYTYC